MNLQVNGYTERVASDSAIPWSSASVSLHPRQESVIDMP